MAGSVGPLAAAARDGAVAPRADQYALVPVARVDRIESEDREFHLRVCEGFSKLAADDPEHWVVVDGSGPPAEVADEVLRAVTERLRIGDRA